ncbi:MAG: hypothetical protein L7V86_26905 [Verrucomicrobiales bacterium]|nr:hypothetical protein [Verrucomicrobiales bacterium]
MILKTADDDCLAYGSLDGRAMLGRYEDHVDRWILLRSFALPCLRDGLPEPYDRVEGTTFVG